MIDNLPPGGLNYRHNRIITNYSSTGSLSSPIFYFLATDPNVAAGTDPRPTQSTDYFAPGTGVLLSRTDWTQSASWFTYKLTWNSIDHEHGADGCLAVLTQQCAGRNDIHAVRIGSVQVLPVCTIELGAHRQRFVFIRCMDHEQHDLLSKPGYQC